MTNHANDAARFLGERITFTTKDHQWVDVTPDPQGSTRHLEELSADLLRDKFPRRPMIEKSPRPFLIDVRQREVSDRDHSLLPGSGREELGDCA